MASEETSAAQESLNVRKEFEKRIIDKAWEDETFKQELMNNPKTAIQKEFGQSIPEDLEIKVLEETPNTSYLVIPRNPAEMEATEELSDEALEAVAGGAIARLRASVAW